MAYSNPPPQCYPAEIFPTRYRATAHGVSAACGKTGAIISSLAFNSLTNKIGTPNVLWSASPSLSLNSLTHSLARHDSIHGDVLPGTPSSFSL
jgi:hypothetical protein